MKIKKEEENSFDLKKLKRYLDKIKCDNSVQYASNANHKDVANLDLILIGKMAMLSEIKRIVGFIEDEK